MYTRSSYVTFAVVGAFILFWALYPYSDLAPAHPLTWFQLLLGCLLNVVGMSGLLNTPRNSVDQEWQTGLVAHLVFGFIGGACVLFFAGSLFGFWSALVGKAAFFYLDSCVALAVVCCPFAVAVLARRRASAAELRFPVDND